MKLPKHIGIIMDGNRRWAKSKMLPKLLGHKYGADNISKIVKIANNLGIKYLTLRALSTDNLIKRDKEEINGLIKLINNVENMIEKMMKIGIKFETIGNISLLPEKTQNILNKAKETTKNNNGLILIIALVYGGQDEIVRAIHKASKDGVNMDNINIETFRKYLDIGRFPNPDLIIRTGGDIRHSGFLLYNSAYSEYYFTEKYRPAFDEEEFKKALEIFGKSKRNFGK